MKTAILILSFAALSLCSCSSGDKKVYICTGPYARSYHKDKECHGLSQCSGEIKAVTEAKAKDMGRHKCGFCY